MLPQWLRISLLLCCFGFFREMRPSEPFVVDYFVSGGQFNLTDEDINRKIFPAGTYSVLIQSSLVFSITDILLYKPIIVLSALCGIVLFAILLWTKTVRDLLIGQVFYGTFTASEVAYYTYIYAKVDKQHYQIVSGHTRSAILCGKFFAAVLAQTLISMDWMSFRGLHYISFASQLISLFIAISLPTVKESVYFYKSTISRSVNSNIAVDITVEEQNEMKFSWYNAGKLLMQHLVAAYTNSTILKWSLWWSLITCGQLQVISYIQILWKEIDVEREDVYNGAVEATVTLLGAGAALMAGSIKTTTSSRYHWWTLIMCPLLIGVFIMLCGITYNIWLAYLMYILFGTVFFFIITIGSAMIAQNLKEDDSFGLIFGINTLIALLLQTLMTWIIVTDMGYALNARSQYITYGIYFILIGIAYSLLKFISFYLQCK